MIANNTAEKVNQYEVEQQRPFGLRDKIAYLFGDFGNDFSFDKRFLFHKFSHFIINNNYFFYIKPYLFLTC